MSQDRNQYQEPHPQAISFPEGPFAGAFYHSGIGMALISPSGHFLHVNDALCGILGYSAEELVCMSFQQVTHPDDLSDYRALLQQLLNGQAEKCRMEKRYKSASGQTLWMNVTVTMDKGRNGEPAFLIAQLEDVTAEKKLRESLATQNLQLQTAVKGLEQRLKLLDEIAHVIGHNFRGAVGNIKVLTDLYYRDSGLTKDEIIGMIEQSGSSMLSSLSQMAELADATLERDVQREECVFARVFDQVQKQLQGTIADSGAKIVTLWEVESVQYPIVYMESILYNLLSNALKYRKPDQAPLIIVSTYAEDGRTVLSVKDNGLGLDLAQYGDRVFKLHQTFHEGFDSHGIGLFLTRSQVEGMGGSISVVSAPGQGAQFLVRL